MRLTHDATFHIDDAIGNYILEVTNPNDELVRTRDLEFIKKHPEAIVFDVGGKFEGNVFDHHQKGFDKKYYPTACTKMSSAGLLYQRYGRKFLEGIKVPKENINEEILLLVYKEVFEPIDAKDNGVTMKGNGASSSKLSIWHYVASMNYKDRNDDVMQLKQFKECSRVCGEMIRPIIHRIIKQRVQYKEDSRLYRQYFDERFQTHKSGKIMHIKHDALNYFECIKEVDANKNLYYTISSREKEETEECTIRTMQDAPFKNRFDLIDPPDDSPVKQDLRWIHVNKFIAKVDSYDAAIRYCEYCIEKTDAVRTKMTVEELRNYLREKLEDDSIEMAYRVSTDHNVLDTLQWKNTLLSATCDGYCIEVSDIMSTILDITAQMKFEYSPGMVKFDTDLHDTFDLAAFYIDFPEAIVIEESESTWKQLIEACKNINIIEDGYDKPVAVRDMKIPNRKLILIS